MARAGVESLALTIANSVGDTNEITRIYDDVVFDLGRGEIITQLGLIAGVSGTASYAFPSAAIEILGVFYDDTELRETTIAELDTFMSQWRDMTGRPIVYLLEGEDERTFRLIPTPVDSSGSVAGLSFGADYPTHGIGVIYTEDRTDLMTYLELPVAVGIAAREMRNVTNHQDLKTSEAFSAIADILFSMVR